MSWRAFTHHTLKTLLRIVQVVVFAVIPGILVWLQVFGLPKAFFPPLVEAAARQGLALEFSRMRLSLLQGLVLDDVRLRARNLPANNEVAVDRAAVSLNWRRVARGQVELNALDLRGAQLFLPVETEGGIVRTIRLTKARARLLLSDGVVSVPLAQFNLQGIDIAASGQVLLDAPSAPPPAHQAPASPPAPKALMPPEAGRALEILESLDFGEKPPVLEVEFSAHSGNLAALSLPRVVLRADKTAHGKITLRDINLDASYAGQVITVRRLSARDDKGGTLAVSGQWNLAGGNARADIESCLDPIPWLAQLLPDGPWAEVTMPSPPAVQAALEIVPGTGRRVRITGSAETGPFEFREVRFGGLTGGFAWRDGDFYASDIVLGMPSGKIRADLMMQPDDVRLRIDCQADPVPLAVLLDAKAREGIRKIEVEFTDTPSIRLEASGRKLAPASLTARGTLKLGRTSIHGSPMENATADVAFEGLALKFTNMRVNRSEGSGSGSFTYDFGNQVVRLENIRSTMNPFNVLQWADPNVARETQPYRFKAPPSATVNGVIGLKDPLLTRLTAEFNAPQGLDYDLLERTLNFSAASGTLKFTGRQIAVDIPSARLFGGKVKLAATVNTAPPGARQKVAVDLDAVNFETLTRLYFDYKDSKGLVSGRYDFSFVAGQPLQMKGTGNLLVQDGNVFAIPVLGPLSLLLGSIIPGTGYQTARRATCDFRVSNGEIRTDNLDILGTGFSMLGQGSLFFVEDRMDFAIRVNAKGVPGVILYPVSKLFEYVSDGKMSEPVWRPKLLPKGGGGKPEAPAGKPEKPAKPSAEAKRNGRV